MSGIRYPIAFRKAARPCKNTFEVSNGIKKPSPFLFNPRPNLWTQNSDKCRIDKAAKCLSQKRYFRRNNKVRFCEQHIFIFQIRSFQPNHKACVEDFKLMHTVVNSWPQIQNFQTLYDNIWPRKFERYSLQQNWISTRIDHFLHLGKTSRHLAIL